MVSIRRWDIRHGFTIAFALIVALLAGLVRSSLFQRDPSLLALAVTVDVLVTLPLLYYLCVVRTRRAAPITLIPCILASLTLWKMILPGSEQPFLRPVLVIGPILEVISLGLLFLRIRRHIADRQAPVDNPAGAQEDSLGRIQEVVRLALGENRLTDVVLTEVMVLYFGLFGGFRRFHPPAAAYSTCYRKSGWTALVGVLLFLILIEGAVVHLLIARWNLAAAWLWNAFDLYAVLWLLADLQGLRLRPLLLTPHNLDIRVGFRWNGTLPLTSIVAIQPFSEKALVGIKRAGYMRATASGEPDRLLTLREPICFHGVFGMQRSVRYVGIDADDPAFLVRLEEALAILAENKQPTPG